jgi:hypothetical protein
MYMGGMFWKQIYNPDDGDRDSPQNGEFQPLNMADGLRRFY